MKHTKRPDSRFFFKLFSKYSKNYNEHVIWENPFKTRRIVTRLFLLSLPVLLFTLYHVYTLVTNAAVNTSYDVVVVGGGTGGVSAAIQAARQGVRVGLIESTDWLGGQAAAAGVSNMDEGANERSSGIYSEFVNRVASKYGGAQYIHKCYFGGNNICPEPHVVRQVLEEMVAGTGRIDVYYRHSVTSVLKSGNIVTGVTTHSSVDNANNQFGAKVIIDATEYGDLLPKAGIAYRIGSQNSGSINTAACIQDITYTAVVKRYDGGIPSYLQITTAPPGYNSTIESRFSEMVTSSGARDNGNAPYYWSWIHHNAYRGMADSTRPSTTDAGSGAASITKTGINFANDYPAEKPYNNTAGNTTLSVRYIEDTAYRKQADCDAKLKTIQFIYYMQKSGQNWSVADDEGFDTSYNQSENSCSNIPTAFKEIEKRLPVMPYVRESRRMIGVTTYTSSQLRAQKQSNRLDGSSVKAVNFSNSIAIGGYDDDLHNCNDASTLDSSIDLISDKGMGGGTFQIPLEALIPQSVDGFIAAEKNISQSRLVNGATRLQPITMLTGQAAGALGAISAQSNRQPRTIKPIEVQLALANAKSYLALAQFNDVTPGNAYFAGVQIASLYNVFYGDGSGNFNTSGVLTRGTGAILLTRLLNIPTNGTEDDAITQIRLRGYTTASSNAAYNPGNTLIKGDLAVLLARALGQSPGSVDGALSSLSSLGIPVECTNSGCAGDSVTRGIFANAAAYSLKYIQNGITPTTPIPQGNPASNLQVNTQPTQVSLSWSSSSGIYANTNASDGDHIQIYSNSNFTGTRVLDGGVGDGTQSWTIPVNNSGEYNSVQPGKTYYARIYTFNAPCNCSDGVMGSFTVPNAPIIGEVAQPASDLSISAQAAQISLTWTASSGKYTNTNANDNDHIQVYSNPNFTGTKVLDGGVGGGTQSWTIPVNNSGAYNSVQPGKTYYARIYSFNAPCNCSDGTTGSFTVPGNSPTTDKPASNLSINAQSSQVSISWSPSTGSYTNRDFSDNDHIQIYSNSNFTGTKILDGGVGGGTTSWNIPVNTSGSYNSVKPGLTYYARIYSFNAPCNCSNGTNGSFTVPGTNGGSGDSPATNLQAGVQSSQVTLSWSQSKGVYMNRDTSDSDHIQVYSNSNFTGTKVLDGGVGGGTQSWTIPVNNSGAYNSVQPGKTYYARIYSFNAPCNCSDGTTTSFTVNGTTNDHAASNLQAAVQSNQVVLSWAQSSGTYMNRDTSDSDHIQVYTNPDFSGTKVLDGGVGGGTQSWSIPITNSGTYNSLNSGTTYYARIYSFNAPCNCSSGTTTSFRTP